MGTQLQIHRRVKEWFPVSVHLCYNRRHILQVALRQHGLLKIVRIAAVHAVFVRRVADDLLFLHRRHMAGIDPKGHPVFFPKMGKDRLLIGRCRVFPQRPHAAEGIAADKVIGFKLDDRWGDHIQKLLDPHIPGHFGCRSCICSSQMSTSFNRPG